VRAIAESLGQGYGLPQLTARGLVATCTACGGIMGARDRHCPGCGAAAGDTAPVQAGELPPPLEEPTYDDEIAVHQTADDDYEDGELEDEDYEAIDAEEVATDDHEKIGVTSSPASDANGGSPPPWSPSSAEPKRKALVPRAQRTLRAGRRIARHWIEERRSSGS
jgi:hypothetical protein